MNSELFGFLADSKCRGEALPTSSSERTGTVAEAIRSRVSVRAYRPEPVPKDLLAGLLDTARWAPSWCNSQPWEFVAAGGEPLSRLRTRLYSAARNLEPLKPDFAFPGQFPEVHENRRRENGKQLFTALGIARDDKAARLEFNFSMLRFFDAPAAVIVGVDRSLNPVWSALDAGCAVQSLVLAAWEKGLGTCIEASIAAYPHLVSEELDIDSRFAVLCGVAIGWPETGNVKAEFRTPRASLDELVTWRGF